jgi:CheY-like chemotaxis protein
MTNQLLLTASTLNGNDVKNAHSLGIDRALMVQEKILVIDDDVPSCAVLKLAMEAMGHEVFLAISGEAALDAIQSFIPDVVLCDINMPGIKGYEVCIQMKTDPRLDKTLFIAQTGLSSAESTQLSIQAGFKYHLVKPIDINALLELVFFEKMNHLAIVGRY